MTPFGHRLKHALDVERERMLNEWFFKWHFIGKQGPVEIDGFDGRKISYGGISFWGTPREVYWSTLNRYARKKIDGVFAEVEEAIRTYPAQQALLAVGDAEELLKAFLVRIAENAVDKDRVLRGNGTDFPEPDRARQKHLLLAGEVHARASALRSHLAERHQNQEGGTDKSPRRSEDGVLILKPSLWGIGIDLRRLWDRIRGHT